MDLFEEDTIEVMVPQGFCAPDPLFASAAAPPIRRWPMTC